MSTDFRQGICGVFRNDQGLVLVGERCDHPGAWQLPQGGIEPGESAIAALYREMKEETGCDAFSVVRSADETVKYSFPRNLKNPIAARYAGQSLYWFLLKLSSGQIPDPEHSEEFRGFKWVSVEDAIQGVIDWKRPAYERGFRLLKLLLPIP